MKHKHIEKPIDPAQAKELFAKMRAASNGTAEQAEVTQPSVPIPSGVTKSFAKLPSLPVTKRRDYMAEYEVRSGQWD
ncbi:MAG: hypothetical protein M3Q80_01735 [bacterium]|nr:hypothetical protein [bacterium]